MLSNQGFGTTKPLDLTIDKRRNIIAPLFEDIWLCIWLSLHNTTYCAMCTVWLSFFFILLFTQDAVRNSVCHTATVIANSFMHTGTTSDQFLRYGALFYIQHGVHLYLNTSICYLFMNWLYCFLLLLSRENLEWLARATNWAKFTATASLGVIHKVCYYSHPLSSSMFILLIFLWLQVLQSKRWKW